MYKSNLNTINYRQVNYRHAHLHIHLHVKNVLVDMCVFKDQQKQQQL